jgi:hypothetical protein
MPYMTKHQPPGRNAANRFSCGRYYRGARRFPRAPAPRPNARRGVQKPTLFVHAQLRGWFIITKPRQSPKMFVPDAGLRISGAWLNRL